MHTKTVTYFSGETEFNGYLAFDAEIKTPRPGILIAPAWRGLDEFAKKKAAELAQLGYVALAADVYGKGTTVTTNEEAAKLMSPLFVDRALLQQRIASGFQLLKAHPLVDPKRIGGIGFCFGGLAILELFRSGEEVRAVVTFHALLGTHLGELQATSTPLAKGIKGSILLLHGHDDPLVSKEDVAAVQKELTNANIDWQMNIYGNTSHAFTNPEAHDTQMGLIYNSKADKRSWKAMRQFFDEAFE